MLFQLWIWCSQITYNRIRQSEDHNTLSLIVGIEMIKYFRVYQKLSCSRS